VVIQNKWLLIGMFSFFAPVIQASEFSDSIKPAYIENEVDHEDYVEHSNNYLSYCVVTAGILVAGGLIYWYQDHLPLEILRVLGKVNEHGQVVINSSRGIELMSNSTFLLNSSYRLVGGIMEGGKIKRGTLVDGSYFTVGGINYVVKN